MSVLVISAILLVLIFTLGVAAFFDRFDTLDTESKRVSLALAEACGNIAMVKIAQNAGYTGNETITVDTGKFCKICTVSLARSTISIVTRALYGSAYTNLQIQGALSPSDISITRWSEMGTYTGPTCLIP